MKITFSKTKFIMFYYQWEILLLNCLRDSDPTGRYDGSYCGILYQNLAVLKILHYKDVWGVETSVGTIRHRECCRCVKCDLLFKINKVSGK